MKLFSGQKDMVPFNAPLSFRAVSTSWIRLVLMSRIIVDIHSTTGPNASQPVVYVTGITGGSRFLDYLSQICHPGFR